VTRVDRLRGVALAALGGRGDGATPAPEPVDIEGTVKNEGTRCEGSAA